MPPAGPTAPEGAMLSLVTLSYVQDEFEYALVGGASPRRSHLEQRGKFMKRGGVRSMPSSVATWVMALGPWKSQMWK